MLTIDLSDAPSPIEEKDKFVQYIGAIVDAFRVDPAEEAELLVATDDPVMKLSLYYGIRAFLINQVDPNPDILTVIRDDCGKWTLKKINLPKREKLDRSGDAQNI